MVINKNLVDVIFTGLIRNPELFKKSIRDMVNLRKEGFIEKIIFSTWDYEIKKYEGMRDFLKKSKIILLESEEPKERGKGNIFCQMKSLEVGLENISPDKFVLKTRCDIYINPEFLKMLIKNKESLLKIRLNLPNGNIFKAKVWVPYFEITSPFHIGDEAFFGLRDDLKKLINYEYYDRDYKIRGGAAHVQRYIHPFIEKYPFLKEYLIKHSNVGFPKDNKLYRGFRKGARILGFSNIFNKYIVARRFKILKKRFKEEGFIEALAIYYSILYSYFYIDINGIENEYNNKTLFKRNTKPKKKVNEKEIAENFTKEHIFVKTKGHIYSTDMKFLNALFEKKVEQKNEVSKRIEKAIAEFIDEKES